MLNKLYEQLGYSSVAVIIISISLILFLGFFATRITKLLKLPNVTAYVATGVIIGPFCLNLIPQTVIGGMGFISDIALAFISFGIGEFFKVGVVKKNIKSVTVITLMGIAVTTVLIFSLCYFVFGLNLAVSIILASISFVVSPVSTAMTIRQKDAKGDFVDNLLSVIACNDILGLIFFSIAISLATGLTLGSVTVKNVLTPILLNLVMMVLGVISGFILKLLMTKRSNDNRLIVSIALLVLLCGVGSAIGVSPLLGCMIMGMVYINVSGDEKLFKQIRYFSPPILLIYFVRSGLNFDIGALFVDNSSVTALPLIVLCIFFIIVQMLGKYGGSYIGCKLMKKPKEFKNYFGLALIPQAGIAIGLADLASRYLVGSDGNTVKTIIISVGLICEIFGPLLADFALNKSGSYHAQATVVDEGFSKRQRHEDLIKKLNDIKQEIKDSDYYRSDSEEAFMELEDEEPITLYNRNKNFKNRR
ncbi:MAG: cation:proton antiporter [Clostridia bacterium]|nr:cation:proton antiporter [Clostridia bacterium]